MAPVLLSYWSTESFLFLLHSLCHDLILFQHRHNPTGTRMYLSKGGMDQLPCLSLSCHPRALQHHPPPSPALQPLLTRRTSSLLHCILWRNLFATDIYVSTLSCTLFPMSSCLSSLELELILELWILVTRKVSDTSFVCLREVLPTLNLKEKSHTDSWDPPRLAGSVLRNNPGSLCT